MQVCCYVRGRICLYLISMASNDGMIAGKFFCSASFNGCSCDNGNHTTFAIIGNKIEDKIDSNKDVNINLGI